MPHEPRDTAAGLFHIFTHCVWVSPAYFRDDIDRANFLRKLARVTAKADWKCAAFCLMTTHYHLIVDVADGALPRAMNALNLAHARNFNRRHSLRGHVQFRRYGSRRIDDGEDLLRTYAYVMNNPVEAGLCTKASDWPWSSFAGTVGLAEAHSFVDPSRVLACFRWPDDDPRAALRAYVEKS